MGQFDICSDQMTESYRSPRAPEAAENVANWGIDQLEPDKN